MQLLDEVPAVIVMGDPTWRPSLVGLAANKLAEEYGRPAFIWGKDGNDVYKGSARSGGATSVVRLMHAAADAFSEYGGHHVHSKHILFFFCMHDMNHIPGEKPYDIPSQKRHHGGRFTAARRLS